MKPDAPLNCLHCNRTFMPDCRHRLTQRYCEKPKCKRARQAASLERWRQKPENAGFWRGAWNVERVQEWRAQHPEYWKRGKRRKAVALQNAMELTEVVPRHLEKTDMDENCVTKRIPRLLEEQSPVMVGLIAQLTGSTLQNAIGEMTLRLFETGRAVMGHEPESNYENRKENTQRPATAASA